MKFLLIWNIIIGLVIVNFICMEDTNMFKRNIIILLMLMVLLSGCNDGYGDYQIANGYSFIFRPTDMTYIMLTDISPSSDEVKELAFDNRYIYLKNQEEDFIIIDALKRKRIVLLINSEQMFNKIIEANGLVLETPQELIKNQKIEKVGTKYFEEHYHLLYEFLMYESDNDVYVIAYNYYHHTGNYIYDYMIPNKVLKVEYDNRYLIAEQLVSEKLYFSVVNPDYESGIEKINYWYIDTYTREKHGPYTIQEINQIKKELNLSDLTVMYPNYDKTY